MLLGKNEYKLILLDTNALREIVTNENYSGKGFLSKFFAEQRLYAPCFSIYNAVELMPYKDIYEKFLDFFSTIPCLMFFPIKLIIQEEYQSFLQGIDFKITNQVANSFNPIVNDDSYNCRRFFERLSANKELMQIISDETSSLKSIATTWESQRNIASKQIAKLALPENMIDEKYYRFVEKETIIKDLINWGIEPNRDIDLEKFPSIRIMEYSQFNRIHCTKKTIKPNDVMDITISGIVPYLNAVITENYQANVYKKAKSFIPQMQSLEIYTLKDIREC